MFWCTHDIKRYKLKARKYVERGADVAVGGQWSGTGRRNGGWRWSGVERGGRQRSLAGKKKQKKTKQNKNILSNNY